MLLYDHTLTLFRMGFFGAAHGWGQKTLPTQNVLYKFHNYKTWHAYTLTKKCPKNKNCVRHPLSSADINIFQQKLAIFVLSGNQEKKFILIHTL